MAWIHFKRSDFFRPRNSPLHFTWPERANARLLWVMLRVTGEGQATLQRNQGAVADDRSASTSRGGHRLPPCGGIRGQSSLRVSK